MRSTYVYYMHMYILYTAWSEWFYVTKTCVKKKYNNFRFSASFKKKKKMQFHNFFCGLLIFMRITAVTWNSDHPVYIYLYIIFMRLTRHKHIVRFFRFSSAAAAVTVALVGFLTFAREHNIKYIILRLEDDDSAEMVAVRTRRRRRPRRKIKSINVQCIYVYG